MAFDQYHSIDDPGSSFFSVPFKQAILTEDCTNGSQHFSSALPSSKSSVPEDFSQSCSLWQAQNDQCHLVDYPQNCTKNRNFVDGSECGSESDLYGLVSHILEETDQMERAPSNFKSVWSPYSAKESSQQDFQLESEMQSALPFLGMYSDQCNKGKVQCQNEESPQTNEFCDYFSSFDIGDQWLCPPNDRDTNACLLQNENVQEMSIANNLLLKTRSERDNSSPPGKDDRFHIINPLSNQTDRESPSGHLVSKMANNFFDFSTDYHNQNQLKPSVSKQLLMKDKIKPASSMEKLLVTEEGSYISECQNNQTEQRLYEDHISNQHTCTSSQMQAFESPATLRKELADLEVQKTPNHVGRVAPPSNAFCIKGFSGLSSHQPMVYKYIPEPKSFSAGFSHMPSFPSKHIMQKINNTSENPIIPQYGPHHDELIQHQNWARQVKISGVSGSSKIPPFSGSEFASQHLQQMQRDMLRYPGSSMVNGHNLYSSVVHNQVRLNLQESRKPTVDSETEFEMHNHIMCNSLVKETTQQFVDEMKLQSSSRQEQDKKHAMLQNSYLDLLGNVNSHRHGGGNAAANLGKTNSSPVFSYMHSTGDLKETPWPLQGKFPSRFPLPYSNPISPMDPYNILPKNELPQSNPYRNVTSTETPASVPASMIGHPSLAENQCGPTSQLHFFLEECYEQWRLLEKQRKKTENILAKSFPDKWTLAVSSCPILKVPPNPSRVDRLIVGQLREHAKVVSVLGRMECLRSVPLHASVCCTLDRHLEAIYIVQARRKEEFLNTSKRQRHGGLNFRDNRDVLLLAAALKDLCISTKMCRSALWCALQVTLQKAVDSNLDGQTGTRS